MADDLFVDRISLLIPGRPSAEEEAAAGWFLETFGPHTAAALIKNPDELKEPGTGHLIWCHSAQLESIADFAVQWRNALVQHLNKGGRVLFTLAAAKLPVLLGLEESASSYEEKVRWDKPTDIFEIRGFLGRPGHPLFREFHGGVYTYRPSQDEEFVMVGHRSPDRGWRPLAVAVDRYYIGFDAEKILVWENAAASARYLAIGGYLNFSAKDRLFDPHMKAFLGSAFRYLVRLKPYMRKKLFWIQQPSRWSVSHDPLLDRPLLPIEAISDREADDFFVIEKPGVNFWDVSGERALVMGEERGGIGELWFHPVRVLKELQLCGGSRTGEHQKLQAEIFRAYEGHVEREYRMGTEGILRESILAHPDHPACLVRLTNRSGKQLSLSLEFETDFRLEWPYPEGFLNRLHGRTGAYGLRITSERFRSGLEMCASHAAEEIRLERRDCQRGILIRGVVRFALPGHGQLDLLIYDPTRMRREYLQDWGGRRSSCATSNGLIIEQSISSFGQLSEAISREVVRAVCWAQEKHRAFAARDPRTGRRGIMAGFGTTRPGWFNGRPGYAWFFGRDSLWCSLAFLHTGDFTLVRENLELLIEYQQIDGKIYHELTTSGTAHYDAADSTPLFIYVVGQYLRFTGDQAFLHRHWKAVKKAYRYCLSTDTDGDGLIENTDAGHGWIEGGALFGAHVTNYLASVWIAALQELHYLAELVGETGLAREVEKRIQTARATFEEKFWLGEKGHYAYGLDRDGKPNGTLCLMPAVGILLEVPGRRRAATTLRKISRTQFVADWGVRMLPEDHPAYNPKGYHTGSVWPLYAGWLSLAEAETGRRSSAWALWMREIPLYRDFARGCVPEVLRGDRYEFAGMCEHQAWSEAMVVLPLYRGLLGMRPDIPKGTVAFRPEIPEIWQRADFAQLRVADESLRFAFERESGVFRYSWHGQPNSRLSIRVQMQFPPGAVPESAFFSSRDGSWKQSESGAWALDAEAPAASGLEVEVTFRRYARFFPDLRRPRPGESSSGYVLVEEGFQNSRYVAKVHGRSGGPARGYLFLVPEEGWEVSGAKILECGKNICHIEWEFPESPERYAFHEIAVEFRGE